MPTSAVVAEKKEEKDNYICEDMKVEILQYLPLRSLARFKCVSKSWRSYIANECLLYSCRPPPSTASPLIKGFFFHDFWSTRGKIFLIQFFLVYKKPSTTFKWIRPFPNNPRIQIVASNNGLLLCSRSDRYPSIQYYVCNPRTNHVISLPKPSNILTKHATIGFHSQRNNKPDSTCFTVVRFDSMNLSSMEICSSETRAWVHMKLKCELPNSRVRPHYRDSSAVFLDGVFYWIRHWPQIYAFDMLNSKFLKLDFPAACIENGSSIWTARLEVVGGALHMMCIDDGEIMIWVFEGKNSTLWTLKHRLSTKSLFGKDVDDASVRWRLSLLGFLPSDAGKIFLKMSKGVFMYDFRSQKIELIYRLNRYESRVDDLIFFPYELYQ